PSAWGFGLLDGVKLLGMNFLGFFDFISNSILMPVVALLTCLFVGYVVKPKTVTDEIERTGKFKSKLLFHVLIKYLAPIFIVLILGFSLLEAVGIITV
ncbi:MAG: sodium-dependent transporter, partial [Clostridia bacterium]|nr:sodium-dependent transporter [Clostridia bacterium]